MRNVRMMALAAFASLVLPVLALVPCEYRPQARAAVDDLVKRLGPEQTIQWMLAHAPEAVVRQVLVDLYGPPCSQPGVVVTNGPVQPAGDWRAALGGNILLVSAPNYHWNTRRVTADDVAALRSAGISGLSFELCTMYGAPGGPKPTDTVGYYRGAVDQLARDVATLKADGLVAHVTFLNSNQAWAQALPTASWVTLVDYFVSKVGTDGVLLLPVSERDGRTPAALVSAITKRFRERWPAAQLIEYADESGPGAWRETHPGSIAKASSGAGGARRLNVSDNGTILAELFGSSWLSGGAPNVGKIREFAARCRSLKTSCVVYSFERSPGRSWWPVAGEAWGGGGAGGVGGVGKQDEIDLSAVKFLHADVRTWPITSDLVVKLNTPKAGTMTLMQSVNDTGDGIGEKAISANPWVIATINGKLYAATWEWMSSSTDTRDMAALEGGHIKKSEFAGWRPKSGETIYLAVSRLARDKNRNGEARTPFKRVVWP